MRQARTALSAGTALVAALVGGTALVPASANAAKKAHVEVSVPDPGQLAAARLEFKVKGTAKPKVKAKLKNEDALPDGVVVAAQSAYEKQKGKKRKRKKGRAVVMLALGNSPAASSSGVRARASVTGEAAVIDVAATGKNISSINFDELPGHSRTFLSVLGPEPQAERDLAQDVYDIEDDELPEDEEGGLDLSEATKIMGLKDVVEPRVITSDLLNEEFPERAIASAIAAAVGPPGAVDADVWGFVTGLAPPIPVQPTASPSPTNPRVLFARSDWTAGIYGVQLSAAGDNQLQSTPDARCQDGAFSPGAVRPVSEASPRVVLSCLFDGATMRLFVDVPFAQPVTAGERAALALPYAIGDYDGARNLPGEALSGRSGYLIKY